MSIEVKLPNLGEGIESGDILEVKVSEGDVITKNQSLLELETGKATVDVPSSHAGKVIKIHVNKGQTVRVGAVLLSLESSGVASDSPAKPAAAPVAAAPAPPSVTPPAPPSPVAAPPMAPPAPVSPPPASAPVATPAPVATNPPAAGNAPSLALEPAGASSDLAAAGPAVRRFAREAGVDLSRIRGTGPGGRITREDVLEAVRSGGPVPASPATPPIQTPVTPTSAPQPISGSPIASDAEGMFLKWGPIRTEPMSRIRQTIAAKMHESWTTVPRVTNFDDADVTELERLRQASKKDYEKSGIKLTSLPFVVKAVAMALKDHPLLNASVDMERRQIIYKDYVNIGIAVDTERGLVVPSLRSADDKSIADIARNLALIAEQARENSFSLDDLRGSTFTISNLGAIGGTYSTPIVNTPEVAILLVGRARKQPVVIDDQVQIRLMMPLSLSYDHRLVDGGAAARFLNEVIEYIAAPGRLVLAP